MTEEFKPTREAFVDTFGEDVVAAWDDEPQDTRPWWQRLLRLERCMRVTFYLNGGHSLSFTCMDFTMTAKGDELMEFHANNQRGIPEYFAASSIICVRARRSWRFERRPA